MFPASSPLQYVKSCTVVAPLLKANKLQSSSGVRYTHRIVDDRIEKSIKGRRIGHCHLPQVYLRCKDCVSITLGGTFIVSKYKLNNTFSSIKPNYVIWTIGFLNQIVFMGPKEGFIMNTAKKFWDPQDSLHSELYCIYTVSQVLADFAVYDRWHDYEALYGVKVSQIEGNGRKFSHIELSNM